MLKIKKNKAAQELVSLRKKIIHTCKICKKEFYAILKAKYCSNSCRCKQYRLKKVIKL